MQIDIIRQMTGEKSLYVLLEVEGETPDKNHYRGIDSIYYYWIKGTEHPDAKGTPIAYLSEKVLNKVIYEFYTRPVYYTTSKIKTPISIKYQDISKILNVDGLDIKWDTPSDKLEFVRKYMETNNIPYKQTHYEL